MALVKYGGGVLGASGSIGGQVHSHNRFGSYIRARSTPVNPQSGRQNPVRAIISALASYWSTTMTSPNRALWKTYADAIVRQNKLGTTVKLTGFNHFVRSNSAILQAGLSQVDAGPIALTLPGADPSFSCVIDEAAQQISVAFDPTLDWNTQDGGALLVSMSIPKAAGRNFISGPMRYTAAIKGIDPGGVTSPQVMSVPFPVATGQQVVCSARIVEFDGRLSDPFRRQSNVAA